jgi:hypothetical protein
MIIGNGPRSIDDHREEGPSLARLVPAAVAALIYMLFATEPVFAWGPAMHVRLASDLLLHTEVLPASLAALLGKFAMDFLYGNIAADVVFAKRFSKVKQFCHHWTTGFGLLDAASDDPGRAFAYGYLAHLACDTVAHNKYVPRQVTVTGTTRSFGHFYWELRADADVAPLYWRRLRQTICAPFPEHDGLMSQQLDRGLLPFHVNRRLFTRVSLLHSERWWYRTVRMWDRVSRWEMSGEMLRRYRREAVDRAVQLLTDGHDSPLLDVDPSGNLALEYTRDSRRYLRRMRRAGLLLPHVMTEMAHPHEPLEPPGRAAG